MATQQSSSKPSPERASASQSKQVIEMDGIVVDALPNSQFKVRLDNGYELLAYVSGKLRRFRIRVLLGPRPKTFLPLRRVAASLGKVSS